jgi:hypothetical protein
VFDNRQVETRSDVFLQADAEDSWPKRFEYMPPDVLREESNGNVDVMSSYVAQPSDPEVHVNTLKKVKEAVNTEAPTMFSECKCSINEENKSDVCVVLCAIPPNFTTKNNYTPIHTPVFGSHIVVVVFGNSDSEMASTNDMLYMNFPYANFICNLTVDLSNTAATKARNVHDSVMLSRGMVPDITLHNFLTQAEQKAVFNRRKTEMRRLFRHLNNMIGNRRRHYSDNNTIRLRQLINYNIGPSQFRNITRPNSVLFKDETHQPASPTRKSQGLGKEKDIFLRDSLGRPVL